MQTQSSKMSMDETEEIFDRPLVIHRDSTSDEAISKASGITLSSVQNEGRVVHPPPV